MIVAGSVAQNVHTPWRRNRPQERLVDVSRLALHLLGPPHIERDGAPITIRRRKAVALLAYLEEEAGHIRVKEILSSAEHTVFINSINLGEVFYILARSRGMRTAELLLTDILPSLPITVIENPLDDVIEAARLKALYPLSFADCCGIYVRPMNKYKGKEAK